MKKLVFLADVNIEKKMYNLRIDNRLSMRDIATILIMRTIDSGKITKQEVEELKKIKKGE